MNAETITILSYWGYAVYLGDAYRGYIYPNRLSIDAVLGLMREHEAAAKTAPLAFEAVDPQLMAGTGDDQRSDEASKQPFPTLTEQRAWIAAQQQQPPPAP